MITQSDKSYEMTVSEMATRLATAYSALIKSGTDFKKFPSVMLWGAPGVGKSQGVRQIASAVERSTGKTVKITDVRLLLFNPVDLRGIPTANAEKTLAVWLKPKIFQMDESDEVVNILFLDEISAAPQSVQAAAYQITLDRTVGEHALPKNCIVIAAGNRITDRSVAYNMPRALANRLCHITVSADVESWRRWALASKISPLVIGFIDYSPTMLMGFEDSTSLAFPTPRSWEMVSNILTHISDDIDAVLPLIVGCIGEDAAYEFNTWRKFYESAPRATDIFKGCCNVVPTRPEGLFLVTTEIAALLQSEHSEAEVKNVLAYAKKLPREFRGKVFSDLLDIKKIRPILSCDRDFDDWFLRSGREWDRYL